MKLAVALSGSHDNSTLRHIFRCILFLPVAEAGLDFWSESDLRRFDDPLAARESLGFQVCPGNGLMFLGVLLC